MEDEKFLKLVKYVGLGLMILIEYALLFHFITTHETMSFVFTILAGVAAFLYWYMIFGKTTQNTGSGKEVSK